MNAMVRTNFFIKFAVCKYKTIIAPELKRILKIACLFFLSCLSLTGRAQQTSLREEVSFLTDSLREGRGFGTGGAQATAFYLIRQMRNAGLRTTVQSFMEGGRIGHNVIGVTPGWFRRYIVVGAYFDGLGKTASGYYPGADSNASGVSALLSLARTFASSCSGDVGIIFVGFDGHNASMAGSHAFVSSAMGDYKVSLMVNLDILGSTAAPLSEGRPDFLIALGGSSWRFSIENANRSTGLQLAYDYYGSRNFTDLFYRRISDQRWFLEAGIPSVMFTSGITMDTNKVTDTAESLDYDIFSKRVELISRWLRSQL